MTTCVHCSYLNQLDKQSSVRRSLHEDVFIPVSGLVSGLRGLLLWRIPLRVIAQHHHKLMSL